jgi:hypothetical protein
MKAANVPGFGILMRGSQREILDLPSAFDRLRNNKGA